MMAGFHPIRAKKARYYEDARLVERIAPPPEPEAAAPRPDDWSGRVVQADEQALARMVREQEDAANGGLRREPELPDHVAIVRETEPAPPAQEFSVVDDEPEDAARQAAARRQQMRGIARQASLDPGDGLAL